jgi:hypothetical protein
MKNILLFSLVLSLFICEMILFLNGSYSDAVNTSYSNDTIWERPAATTEYEMNPDLHFLVPVKFDHSGVRNDGPMETEEKKDIYAFFGDSFTADTVGVYFHRDSFIGMKMEICSLQLLYMNIRFRAAFG